MEYALIMIRAIAALTGLVPRATFLPVFQEIIYSNATVAENVWGQASVIVIWATSVICVKIKVNNIKAAEIVLINFDLF